MSNKYVVRQSEKFSKNVNGREIKLNIHHYENKKACVEFVIEEVDTEKIKRKTIVVCLISAFNIIFLYLNLFHFAFFLLVSTGVSCSVINLLTKVKNERLLIIKSLGIQVTVSYYFRSHSTQFIPWDAVEKIFINEVITLQRVLFFLSIMTKDHRKVQSLIPLFKHTKPRLECLEIVYRQMEEIFS